MQTNKRHFKIQYQRGAVLVVSLIMMAILAIIGITSMRGNIIDIKIHKAMKSRSNAFQCAEAALRSGELWLDSLARLPTEVALPTQSSFQVWPRETTVLKNMEIQNTTWWGTNGWSYGGNLINASNQVGCISQPLFIIEYMGAVDGGSKNIEFAQEDLIDFFRITARSEGISNSAAVVLQTTYGKRFR